MDSSLRTVRYGQFATGQFATWTDRYTDSSLHGQFATDSLLRTVRYTDSSLHGDSTTGPSPEFIVFEQFEVTI